MGVGVGDSSGMRLEQTLDLLHTSTTNAWYLVFVSFSPSPLRPPPPAPPVPPQVTCSNRRCIAMTVQLYKGSDGRMSGRKGQIKSLCFVCTRRIGSLSLSLSLALALVYVCVCVCACVCVCVCVCACVCVCDGSRQPGMRRENPRGSRPLPFMDFL